MRRRKRCSNIRFGLWTTERRLQRWRPPSTADPPRAPAIVRRRLGMAEGKGGTKPNEADPICDDRAAA